MGLIGGTTGLLTGEGWIPGFAQGANIIENVIHAGKHVMTGDPGAALGSILGVSPEHLKAVEDGSRTLFNSVLTSIDIRSPVNIEDGSGAQRIADIGTAFMWGNINWRDTIEQQNDLLERVGMDFTGAIVSAGAMQALAAYGGSLLSSGGLAYFLGNQTGQITQSLDNIEFPSFTNRDVFGITGDANRFNYDEEYSSEEFIEYLYSEFIEVTEPESS